MKPLLAVSWVMGARPKSGVQPARLLSPLFLRHRYRYTIPVRPRSPAAWYTVASPQTHVDCVRSISTGLRFNDVLTCAQLRPQCSRNHLAPDHLSRDGSCPRTFIAAPGGMNDNGNHPKSMSERGIISSPLCGGQGGQFRLRFIDSRSKRHGRARYWM
jgi:hypothetical protein